MRTSSFSDSGRETGNRRRRKKVGKEKGRGKSLQGLRGTEVYFVLYSIVDVVTDNRICDCRVYAYTIHALQTLDSSACCYGHRYHT